MNTSNVALQLPDNVYTRLVTRAAQEHTRPAELIERLLSAPFAGMIVSDPQLHNGQPVIAGTGIAVRTVIGYYKLGLTPEELADELDLALAPVYAALAYYHSHQAEIEADILANTEAVVTREWETAPHG
jgi:uncharacterized protein (DUF433 family)